MDFWEWECSLRVILCLQPFENECECPWACVLIGMNSKWCVTLGPHSPPFLQIENGSSERFPTCPKVAQLVGGLNWDLNSGCRAQGSFTIPVILSLSREVTPGCCVNSHGPFRVFAIVKLCRAAVWGGHKESDTVEWLTRREVQWCSDLSDNV